MPIHDWTCVDAGIFHHFHLEWISSIQRTLNSGLLPPDYYALAEQIAGGWHPDVLTLTNQLPQPGQSRRGGTRLEKPCEGGIAMATTQPKVRFTAKAERDIYARKRNRVVIRHRSEDEVVAMIEVISPGNKSSRQALRSLVNKTNKLMEAGIHFLILDLFPPSKRDPQGIHPVLWSRYDDECDFRLPPDLPLTLVAYAIGEIGEDWQAFIEPVAVGQTLPEMPLFLTPDRYVPLPLEPTYQTAFDGVPRRWRDVLEIPPASSGS